MDDNNSTTPSVDTTCMTFPFITYVCLYGPLAAAGLLGNSVAYLVLRQDRGTGNAGSGATFLLQTMAIADNCFLVTTVLSQSVSALVFKVQARDVYYLYQAYIAVFCWPLVYAAQAATVWLTVLVAWNRYVAICRPFDAVRSCSLKRVKIQVALTMAVVVIYSIPRFFEHRLRSFPVNEFGETTNATYGVRNETKAVETSIKNTHAYKLVYESIFYTLFIYVGPLTILAMLNTSLARELVRIRSRLKQRVPICTFNKNEDSLANTESFAQSNGCLQRPPTKCKENDEADEQSLTRVMITIVVLFIACQTPAFFNQLLYYSLPRSTYRCFTVYFYFYHISNFFAMINSTGNFVVYYALRRRFRLRLYRYFRCSRDLASPMANSHAYSTSYAVGKFNVVNNGGGGGGGGGDKAKNGTSHTTTATTAATTTTTIEPTLAGNAKGERGYTGAASKSLLHNQE